jgi:hypothetical protein
LPIGFNVDLARAICEELGVTCTIQVRRFDTLLAALESGAGRRGDRLDRDHAGNAQEGRLHRPLLPHARALRRAKGFSAARNFA